MTKSDRVLLGQITRPHGVRGEVMVRSYCAEPADIATYGPLSDEAGTREFRLEIRGATTKGLIGRIAGVNDRNAAEALRDTGLYVDRARLPEPEEDEVYQADLIGLSVVDPAGQRLGTVVAVQNFGAGDLIEVRPDGARTTDIYPFEQPFVQEVDLDREVIVVAIDESKDDAPEAGAR